MQDPNFLAQLFAPASDMTADGDPKTKEAAQQYDPPEMNEYLGKYMDNKKVAGRCLDHFCNR